MEKSLQSLTIPVFYILLSLALKERHGYEIMQQVRQDSDGKVRLGPGTLYGAIKRLLTENLIEEVSGSSKRRRYYRLTDHGRQLLNSELQRYQEAVELAEKKNILKNGKLVLSI